MNNETMQLLYNRKSVRAYEKQPIPEADVQAILRAAVEAPTAGNMTLWSAIRVTDEAKKKRLSETCDNQPFIAAAPLVLVFCADYKRWYDLFASLELGETLRRPGEGDMMLAMVDAVIAAHASVVAADALGYGSCYIGDIMEQCETHRKLLHLPPYVFPAALAVFGYPTSHPCIMRCPKGPPPATLFTCAQIPVCLIFGKVRIKSAIVTSLYGTFHCMPSSN